MKRIAIILVVAGLACSSKEYRLGDLKDLWCKPYAEVYCQKAADCGCGQLENFEQDCFRRAQTACVERIDALQDRPEITHFRVQAWVVDGCIELLKEYGTACVMPPAVLFNVSCPLIVNRARLSEPCELGLCEEGKGICLDGLCKELPGEGQICLQGHCRLGLSCFADGYCRKANGPDSECAADGECTAGFLCIDGSCAQPKYGEAFGECLGVDQCPQGTLCLATGGRVCIEPPGEGQSCPIGICKEGFFCSSAERVCRKLPLQGDSCAEGIYCAENLGCDPTDIICKPRPGEGSECLLGMYGPVLCAAGLVCVQQRCAQLPGEGETCGLSEKGLPVCADELGCSFEENGDNICKPKVGEGQSCTNDSNCLNENFCDFEKLVCRKKLGQGQSCHYGNECAEGLTCQTMDGQSSCQPLPSLGQACTSECADGLVCSPRGPGRCVPQWCTAW